MQIDTTPERLEVVTTGNGLAYLAGLMLGLAALEAVALVALLATGRAGAGLALLAPLGACGLVGWMLGRIPHRRTLVATRGGELRYTQVTLFGRSEVRCATADVTAVGIVVGTYWSFIGLRRADGPALTIATFPKRWTWESAAGAAVLGDARRIASFFAVPVDGAPAA